MLWKMVQNILRQEKGQGMVEYGLILAVVAVVALVTLGPMGDTLATLFTTVENSLK